jgi:hypothetical protein
MSKQSCGGADFSVEINSSTRLKFASYPVSILSTYKRLLSRFAASHPLLLGAAFSCES